MEEGRQADDRGVREERRTKGRAGPKIRKGGRNPDREVPEAIQVETPQQGIASVLRTIVKSIHRTAAGLNGVSAAAVVFIMLLTCADVVMRLFGRPIPGTYELVGYFGAVIVAFAMAYTSVERGHIAVELLVDRLPRRPRHVVEALSALAGAFSSGCLPGRA